MDSFARDNLPPPGEWPDLLLSPPFDYPARLNCVAELVDRAVERGWGARPAFRTGAEHWTYADLADKVERIGEVLTGRYGLQPGGRVLLRAPNTPLMIATYLAIIRAGGIAVATMPLLRSRELAYIIDKAQVALAVCDHRLLADLEAARAQSPALQQVVALGGAGPDDLTASMAAAQGGMPPHDTASDDVCLIAFTSGTTGNPKGCMHFHRDMLAICDAYGAQVLRAEPCDVFIGTAPIAFTFGLGAVVLFPLRIGASAVLIEQASPETLLAAIRTFRPTVCFTAPTAYRALLALLQPGDTISPPELRLRRRDPAGRDLARLARRDRDPVDGRDRLDRDAAHLPGRPGGVGAARVGRRARPWLRSQAHRRGRARSPARQRRPARRARPHRLPLPGRQAAARLRDRRLERHRRHVPLRRGRVFLVRGPLRRHDRLGRLQHRRAGGRSGAAAAPRRRRVRGGRLRPTRRGARWSRPWWCPGRVWLPGRSWRARSRTG